MKYRFTEFDYGDLDPEEALFRRYRELREAAYLWEHGPVVGIRNQKLAEKSLAVGLAVFRIRGRQYVAAARAAAAEIEARDKATRTNKKLRPRRS